MRTLSQISLFVLLLLFVDGREGHTASQTQQNSPWNVNFNSDGSDPSRYFGQWPGHRYQPSPTDWRNVGVYQFVTDRLRDGDPTNNDGRAGGYNLYDVGMRHGGDYKGVRESLGYIKSLGFDAIWISPIFQNRFNSYHGYAQTDFTLLDDRFGTLRDFREMVDEAHRLGMYVIVDIVVNHMDNLLHFEGHEKDGAPFRFHLGEYKIFPRNPNETYADFKVENTFFGNGTYSDVYAYDGQKRSDSGQGSYWLSDFHHNGDLGNYDDVWQNHLGKIYGIMDDLRTTHPRVQDKIIAMTKALISSTDIDGIRMDTPMQVPLYFFKRWAPAVKDHARSLGKNNFFIFGEFFCPRARSATMVGRGKTPNQWGRPYDFIDGTYAMDGGINYDFYFSFVYPAIKAQKGGVQNAMLQFREDQKAYDFYNPTRNATNYVMLNFINNHDQWRLNSEDDGFNKTLLGSGIIAFWPGVPLFYYGDEQAFATNGSALDGKSREDFMTSKAWYDLASKTPVNPAVYDNFNMTHSHFLHVQRNMNLRKQYNALRDTDEVYERWVQKDNGNGIYAYTRVWGDKKNWVFVAFNTWRERLEAGGPNGTLFTGWDEGTRIVNALNPTEAYTLGRDGVLPSLWLNGYETKVLVRQDNLQTLNPVVQFIQPSHDAIVSEGNQTVVVGFSEAMKADTLQNAVFYDGSKVESSQIRIENDGRMLKFDVRITEGIHKVIVRNGATAQNGKALIADFQSRFRAGSDKNALVHTQKDPLQDSSLVTATSDNTSRRKTLTLHHKAQGAAKFRVSLDGGKTYGEWKDYQKTSELSVALGSRPDLMVQYWADGSAAYFVRGETP